MNQVGSYNLFSTIVKSLKEVVEQSQETPKKK